MEMEPSPQKVNFSQHLKVRFSEVVDM